MWMKEPTKEDVKKWKVLHATYRSILKPNRKNGKEMLAYIQEHYPVQVVLNQEWQDGLCEELVANEAFKEKVPVGKKLEATCLKVEHTSETAYLFENRASIFQDCEIYIGLEIQSGYMHIEGSDVLYDELFVYQGLDEYDLENPFLVAQYVTLSKMDKMHLE